MKCPACGQKLTEHRIEDISVDICIKGCHGLWLDNYELEKVDEAHESAGESLLDLLVISTTPRDHSKKRRCPKCPDVTMRRFFYDIEKEELELDDCPNCGGTWLDSGELASLRKAYGNEAKRKKAAQDHFTRLFYKDMQKEAARSQADHERIQRFVQAVKYVLPSYWLGKK